MDSNLDIFSITFVDYISFIVILLYWGDRMRGGWVALVIVYVNICKYIYIYIYIYMYIYTLLLYYDHHNKITKQNKKKEFQLN